MWNILDRLKEPSTYAGLSGLMISTALAGVAGVVAMILKDRD